MLRLENAVIGYRAPVLRCTLHIRAGDFLLVEGPNGSGKSSLLRTLAGLLDPISGRRVVEFGRLGWVPQQEAMEFSLPITARELVALGASSAAPFWRVGAGRAGLANPWVEALLDPEWSKRPVACLSGGQRQRVLLARALAASPDCLLLDEPTAGVDAPTQALMAQVLRDFQSNDDRAVVLVTHEPGAFLSVASGFLKVSAGSMERREASHGPKVRVGESPLV